MNRLRKQTLVALCDELAAHPWRDAELDELVDPRHGVISGLQDLLDALEELRRIDLGLTAPAQGVVPGGAPE
jgi:hypothetical protein